MSLSQESDRQRSKEKKALKLYITLGLIGSALVHFIGVNSINWSLKQEREQKQEKKQKPIEFILLDPPQPQEEPVKEIEKKPEIVKENTSVRQPPIKTPIPTPTVRKIEQRPTVVKKPVNNPQTAQRQIDNIQKPEPSTIQQRSQSIVKTTKTNNISSVNSNPDRQETSNPPSSSNTTETNTVSRNTGKVQQAKSSTNTRPAIRCISNCRPRYPSVLKGAEGSARIIVTIDANGNTIDAKFAGGTSNFEIIQQAIIFAKRMRFSSPGVTATVRVNINFSIEGTDFDRKAKERQAEYDRKQQQRQAELERQRQQQQQRQAELERQQQQQQQQQAELERQRKINEILKRNRQLLKQE